ncbi:hypothetical protein V6582_17935 [Agrobacterium vitis]|uniref:hypothetical protein n=1 Tax=Agrobacterium vitis TaxID=373 RepID=UPI0012E8710D|nr:hypothetical protein [Agrobacterium vitis]MVA23211.1 hypothetical protein [Agrobacterium vitis]
MTNAVKGLFGGKQDDTAKKSQQLQQVANDRQLQSLNTSDSKILATRRTPRGRRLFEDGGSTGATAVLS